MPTSLVDALEADSGVTCVVGAGGKKSTLYALADRLERAIVTATVRIPPFADRMAKLAVTKRPDDVVRSTETWPLGLVPAREGDDRYLGYEPATIDELTGHGGVPILVKADGARTRWLKAPAENEPQLPSSADIVVPIASVRIVGKRLGEEHVHRPERVAAVADLEVGDRISPADVATVLTSEAGGYKDVPDGATVVPLLNMADTPELEATAREIATEIRERRDVPRVVVTRLLEEESIVAVV
ncbi:selenium cofactor biosynthesis protein YqeC [Natronobacterium gregoryi]|uniref:Anaerobic dehydrogenase cluster protein n=2 Tax=Natronobacterium gregoryi TaxID=44930 RepID=L0AL40_NATGS|nr:selenium cofactor biosynthesis protein YqeC [Natronobacterium gregoryi]AFZ73912.1 putative selenium-dependent hydroxylase accessory protein YqeC [Natronobacterium gregoryi SP2]ELY71566.1 anaerobic dehydrogenase cluster protein [Natronobacterium gregoryi SP2]PLK19055.1 putative selenium-dependent hydroxylase accessory protein YqeC [Natronobacterium gregoryi SP2]SFJ62974.1 probable selenium-dependent hydroxylase accessory protein YqeC [Natronobacterium gregoryi]